MRWYHDMMTLWNGALNGGRNQSIDLMNLKPKSMPVRIWQWQGRCEPCHILKLAQSLCHKSPAQAAWPRPRSPGPGCLLVAGRRYMWAPHPPRSPQPSPHPSPPAPRPARAAVCVGGAAAAPGLWAGPRLVRGSSPGKWHLSCKWHQLLFCK